MKFALIGNPSVGKSLIFNQLTGLGVEVSNYPGTTVELQRGNTCFQREMIELVDLPGIYSLDGESGEEALVRRFLEQQDTDVVIAVLSATRLERNLYLLLQVAEYGLPMVVVLNMVDEAAKQGLEIDPGPIGDLLGVEVILTAASQGKNIDRIIPAALAATRPVKVEVPYDHHIEAAIRSLGKISAADRKESIRALQGFGENPDLLEAAQTIAEEIESRHRMTVAQIIAANRHNFAHQIAGLTIKEKTLHQKTDLDGILTRVIPGIPILIGILLGMLLVVFVVGSFLEELIVELFDIFLLQPFLALGLPPIVDALGTALILALQAGLGIAFPYVFLFYIIISVLEDSGYMTRAAFLADNAMHRVGMHGGAVIPLTLAFGCNVPAIMSVRLLHSRRERIIASFLVTMVPCSARTVIIAGIVAGFVGIGAAFSVYAIVFALIVLTGLVLSRITPGEQFGMIMEMVPLRRPDTRLVMRKAWMRLSEFLFIAMPLLLVGSVVLGLLEFFGIMAIFEGFVEPYTMALLGLPGYSATALIFGILRKEMAFETLAILAGTADLGAVLSSLQLYIFAVVTVLFIPCLATITVLLREVGSRITLAVTIYTVALGLFIGGLMYRILA
ncbi:MAG TPA: ferrous iron transport protein B [Methanoculleus sp.]|jgi:ferrous iron transport protein B|uniref:ferrous iron transport protein B n=1 Tax=Methanoculleus sp. TaxID=90427 RepID=UPI000A73410D|nr:ferrous iron transport protein B [Methanoculleus sp.]HNT07351.1 ferrous iron transport protein B [Methanoculleus sp.]HNV38329.1 ferrous iron transport protein B [Methanoculleus sp.]HOC83808.1 ferrous iron transport protein B [Methanoculleus sp.]HOF96082.1 ferrous iron transport protein B [Methanoculleus sp.]HOS67543.1 ferrous iron transport protein B [Methanoculleus sp.]